MEEQVQVRRARLDEADWIVGLSARVQAALTASGSLQQIGPLPLGDVERAVCAGYAYLLEVAGRRVGSVLVDPLERDGEYVGQTGLRELPAPLWYLHALMLEPREQGKRYGLPFLEGVKRLVLANKGAILLDCWAGNTKLRDFYQRAGFTFHGLYPEDTYEIAVFFCRGHGGERMP